MRRPSWAVTVMLTLLAAALGWANPAVHRFEREIVWVEPTEQATASVTRAIRVADRDTPLTIVSPSDADLPVRFAASDLQRYLGLTLGERPKLATASDATDGHLILLGNEKTNPLIRRLPVPTDWADLEGDAYGIAAFEGSDAAELGARSVLVIYGTSPKGVANGVYGFLERAAGAWFFPPRIHINYFELPVSSGHIPDAKRFVVDTRLMASDTPRWPRELRVSEPTVRDLGLLIHVNQWHEAVVDWAFRSKLNVITIAPAVKLCEGFKPTERHGYQQNRGLQGFAAGGEGGIGPNGQPASQVGGCSAYEWTTPT